MKRYNLIPIHKIIGCILQDGKVQPIECDEGEWVKYEDMKEEMARIWKDIQPPPSELLHKGA